MLLCEDTPALNSKNWKDIDSCSAALPTAAWEYPQDAG